MVKTILWLLLFVIVFAIAWPLALLALVAWPFLWLLGLPFRLIGMSVTAVFELIEATIGLPARVLRGRSHR